MYSSQFDYYRASTVQEAVQLLQAHPGAKLLAGGHSLLPQMKLRVAQPPALIDISHVRDLAGVSLDGDKLKIGAGTTYASLASSAVIREHCPILGEAATQIGDPQVRNRGTIGGSLAHADPAADLPTVAVALGATLTALGARGSREIAAADFFTDLFTTALGEDEVLTTITVRAYGSGTGGSYFKHDHPASGYAVVGVAAIVMVSGGRCSGASVVVGGATPNPVRATAAEAALKGQALNAANIAAAAAKASEAISDPLSDYYASGEYRRHLATVLAKRALTSAAQRAG
jgi:aerobic carbon-monoxide dehydrogenase medium subunit